MWPAFHVAGLRYAGNNAHGEIAALWEAFLPRVGELLDRTHTFAAYGVTRSFKEAREDEFEYLAGVAVGSTHRLPQGMVAWTIPAQTYAVLPAAGAIDLEPLIDHFYRYWLPRSMEYELVDGPSFEYYPAEYPEQPTIFMHLPVSLRV
jgi:AraC family transcriptional regulator